MKLQAWAVALLAASVTASCPPVSFFNVTYSPTDVNAQICQYSDIRFASAPVGKLRFAAPEYPPQPSPGSKNPVNPACIQMQNRGCVPGSPLAGTGCSSGGNATETEDCLFLDIYVPQAVVNGNVRVPVVTWFYGGGYIFGSKAQANFSVIPLYDGTGLAQASDNSMIFVASNYRLGAYGWLAGTYMENNAQPNAGLLDQRKALQFVQDNIHVINGDPTRVTAWGESAGASSLLHHLTMPDNIQKPLFQQAYLQSPAYQWLWDRNGSLNDTFTQFANMTGCIGSSGKTPIDCLRSFGQDDQSLQKANQNLSMKLACQGIFPVGPSVDGKLVPDIATNLLKASLKDPSKATKLKSIIVSHVDKEIPSPKPSATGNSFIPLPIRQNPNNSTFYNAFINMTFGNSQKYCNVTNSIIAQYPTPTNSNQVERARRTIEDSSFLCNTRSLINAYMGMGTPVYALDYAFGADLGVAVHASDLLPTFFYQGFDYFGIFNCTLKNGIEAETANLAMKYMASDFQSYIVSHALTGDPNAKAKDKAHKKTWNKATTTQSAGISYISNVMQPRATVWPLNPFAHNSVVDTQTGSDVCNFWEGITQMVMSIYNSKSEPLTAADQVILGSGEL